MAPAVNIDSLNERPRLLLMRCHGALALRGATPPYQDAEFILRILCNAREGLSSRLGRQ
jgi:hypothetical protein